VGIVFARPTITIAGIIAAIPCRMLMKKGRMRKRKKNGRKEERIRDRMEAKLRVKV